MPQRQRAQEVRKWKHVDGIMHWLSFMGGAELSLLTKHQFHVHNIPPGILLLVLSGINVNLMIDWISSLKTKSIEDCTVLRGLR